MLLSSSWKYADSQRQSKQNVVLLMDGNKHGVTTKGLGVDL